MRIDSGHLYFFDYDFFAKQIIKTAKVKPSYRHFESLLSLIPETHIKEILGERYFDAMVPIPSKFTSLFFRGFSPAHELCVKLSANHPVPIRQWVRFQWSLFGKRIKKQSRLSKENRSKNMQGAFVATPKANGKRILLVDDIITSGATLNQAKLALLAAGAAEIQTITLAATGFNSQ